MITAVKNQESDEPVLFHFIAIGENAFQTCYASIPIYVWEELNQEDMDLEINLSKEILN